MSPRPFLALRSVAACLAAGRLAAHDFWIQPSNFQPEVGADVELRLFVGPHFEGEPVPRVPQLIQRFVLVPPSGQRRDVPGRAGGEPAGSSAWSRRASRSWATAASTRRHDRARGKFEEYLKEEGLEKIPELRKKRGDTEKPAREVFSRCAKSLHRGRRRRHAGKDRALGLTLELVAEKDPYALGPGGELPVVLLLEGKPLAGALVQANLHGDPSVKAAARTDRRGRATLRLAAPGFWLVKAVHMPPAPAGVDADWESLWASLTFENGPKNPIGRAP